MRYWVRVGDESKGPFGPDHIRDMPNVTMETWVCPEGAQSATDWTQLRDIAELARVLRQLPGPPPFSIQQSPLPLPSSSQAESVSTTTQTRSSMAIVALVLTILNIPWDYIAFKGAARLLGGRVADALVCLAVLLLLPIVFNIALAAVSWFRASKSASRSGTGLTTVALIIGAIHLVFACLFFVVLYRADGRSGVVAQNPTPILSTAASMTVIPAGAPSSSSPAGLAAPTATPPVDVWAGKEQEAIAFVKNFPLQAAAIFPRCPRSIEAVQDGFDDNGELRDMSTVTSWPETKSFDDLFECNRFLSVEMLLLEMAMMEKQNGGSQDVIAQFRLNPGKLWGYVTKVTTSWDASQQDGPRYRVNVHIKEDHKNLVPGKKFGTPVRKQTTWVWLIDMTAKTLKPLNWGSWIAVDASHADARLHKLTMADPEGFGKSKDIDSYDVSGIAPTYRLGESTPREEREHEDKASMSPSTTGEDDIPETEVAEVVRTVADCMPVYRKMQLGQVDADALAACNARMVSMNNFANKYGKKSGIRILRYCSQHYGARCHSMIDWLNNPR